MFLLKDDLQVFLCNLNETETEQLSQELQDSMNWTSITENVRIGFLDASYVETIFKGL